MQRSQPFARAAAMFSLIAAAMALPMAQRQLKISEIGPYESRGKGEGRSNRRPAGAGMAAKRAARKARNVRRHRAHCKG